MQRQQRAGEQRFLLSGDNVSLFFSGGLKRGERTAGTVECMSLIHYPHFLLFKTSPVIIVMLTCINTSVISFGSRGAYDIYPPTGRRDTEAVYVCGSETAEKAFCVFFLCVCRAERPQVYARNCSRSPPAERRPSDALAESNSMPTPLANLLPRRAA